MTLSCGRKIWTALLWATIVALLSWMAHPSRGQEPAGNLTFFDRLLQPNYCKPGRDCGPQGCPVPKRQSRPGKVVSRPVAPVRRPHPSVVRVINRIGNRDLAGSGTYIRPVESRCGYVLSCEHLFSAGIGRVTATFPDGKRYNATVKAVDRTWDLAVMTIDSGPRIAVRMGTAKPQLGEIITYCGYGQGYGLNRYRYRNGKLTNYGSPGGLNRFELLIISGSSRDGDSGGPLLNAKGDLVGVLADTGVNEKATAGPNCEIINKWLAGVLGGEPVEPPPTPNPTPQPTPSKLAVLEKQIAALTARVAELESLEPIPVGNDGKRGLRGRQGERGATGKFDKTQPLFTAEFVIDGKVIRTLEVKPGGTLPLELSTTKRNRGSKRE